MKKYSTYKDSGIDGGNRCWIGEIPEHWEVKRAKHISQINPQKGASGYSSDSTELAVFLPMEKVSEGGSIDCGIKKPISDLWNGFTYFETDDVILAKITPCFENGKSAFLANLGTQVGFGSTEFHVVRAKAETYPKFLYYITKSNMFMEIGESSMIGSAGQKRVPTEFVENFQIGFPPLPEQQAIVTYLDEKTTLIDDLIKKKQEKIQLLKENRTALINHAVTKGLDPEVKMKDSGVEWIGEIPEHWIDAKLKHVTNQINDGTHFTPTYCDSGIPFLRVTDIHNETIDLEQVKFISIEEHRELIKRCKPERGDLLLSKNGTIGLTKIVDWDWEFSVFVSLCLIKFKPTFLPELFSFLFQSDVVEEQISEGSKKSTVTNLHLDKIRELRLLIPPIPEQQKIVNYLNEQTQLIDQIIQQEEQKIELLKEYRQSLISEVVTGKICVV